MGDWIAGLIAYVASGLGSAVSAIAGRIAGVWNIWTSFAGGTKRVIDIWRTFTAQWVATWTRYTLAQYFNWRWLTLVQIPRLLAALASALRAWALEQIRLASRVLTVLISAVRDELRNLVAQARAALIQAVTSLLGALNAVIVRVVRLERLALKLLDAPEHLAAWLVVAMASALLRFALSNAERLARMMWAARTKIALESADRIETILARII